MKIIVHVGPPKTGTSAIQHWCNTNREVLKRENVFYPSHTLDANGISSGNLLNLYDRDELTGELTYSAEKLNVLIEQAKEVDADVILLSSEFFFKKITELAENIPTAVFLVYIRFELDVLESNYNQSVKRHGKKEAFALPREPKSQSIKLLTRYVKEFGKERFVFRPYSAALYKGSGIVTDLLSQVCDLRADDVADEIKRINTRYSPEGVELKRWFNKFELGELQQNLDLYLQKEGKQSKPYSFISKNDYERLKVGYIDDLTRFFEFADVANSSLFIGECQSKSQSIVKLQQIGLKTFSRLIDGFIKDKPENARLLSDFYSSVDNQHLSRVDKLRLSELYRRLPFRLKTIGKLSEGAPSITNFTKRLVTSQFRRHDSMALSSSEKLFKNISMVVNRNVYPKVEVISHHIPKTAGRSLELSLAQAYGEKAVFSSYQGSGAKELRQGQNIWVPSGTAVVHGHFPFNENQLEQFPNAVHICWVRDPLERLWSHFNHILNYEQPPSLYDRLHVLASTKGVVDKSELFEQLLESSDFMSLKNTYKTYITEAGQPKFDFIGSVHRFPAELDRLADLLGKQLVSNEVNKSVSEDTLPEYLIEKKPLLMDEYDFIGRYL